MLIDTLRMDFHGLRASVTVEQGPNHLQEQFQVFSLKLGCLRACDPSLTLGFQSLFQIFDCGCGVQVHGVLLPTESVRHQHSGKKKQEMDTATQVDEIRRE